MVGTVFNEPVHPAEMVLSEANGNRSRDTITIASGAGKLAAGTVVGKITSSGKWYPAPDVSTSGEVGAEVAAGVTLYAVDATSADVKVAALTRACEVNGNCLTYAATIDDPTEQAAKVTQLAAAGIIVR